MSKSQNSVKQPVQITGEQKTRRIIIIAVSILLGALIIFGSTLGIITGVRRSRYVIRLKGEGIDRGVASYLAASYKTTYMATLRQNGANVSDTEAFWSQEVYNGNTYGDYLAFGTEQYIREILAAAVIFDETSRLTSEDKETLKLAVYEILSYRADGSVEQFDTLCEPMGFDYKDFKAAATLIYKATRAASRIYGEGGANAAYLTDECDAYYMGYSRVKMIFIRTEDTFALDAEGNRITDTSGNDTLRPLTDYEREEREGYISRLNACIEGINDGSVAPEQFDALAKEITEKYKENSADVLGSGYYLHGVSAYTKEFSKLFPTVLSQAFDLYTGECGKVEIGADDDSESAEGEEDEESGSESGDEVQPFVGVCFMYKAELEPRAYTDTKSNFFSDFYSLVAKELYKELLDGYIDSIELTDKWSELNITKIPYNTEFIPRF
ncbi:MAG: hypothetical protein E7617_02380 [Ruminococcaceae bacterium]|nr:hypothetical protein [Oscillospiraceae bacterium]